MGFVGTGLSGFVPLMHGNNLRSWAFPDSEHSVMEYYLGERLFIILGAPVMLSVKHKSCDDIIGYENMTNNNMQAQVL